jgi:hypothetical protein
MFFAAGCGVGGGGSNGLPAPTGPITLTVFGQGKASATTPGNRLQIAHGTSGSVHLAVNTYVGMYMASVVIVPAVEPVHYDRPAHVGLRVHHQRERGPPHSSNIRSIAPRSTSTKRSSEVV